jgi:hypothetical protein
MLDVRYYPANDTGYEGAYLNYEFPDGRVLSVSVTMDTDIGYMIAESVVSDDEWIVSQESSYFAL